MSYNDTIEARSDEPSKSKFKRRIADESAGAKTLRMPKCKRQLVSSHLWYSGACLKLNLTTSWISWTALADMSKDHPREGELIDKLDR